MSLIENDDYGATKMIERFQLKLLDKCEGGRVEGAPYTSGDNIGEGDGSVHKMLQL